MLSVCLQLLDFIADPSNPIKREVLIDMCDLPGTTGAAITTAILNSLQKHAIDITNCRGEAYYANASMSSDKKGVQAEIARCAPDAEYQGCCLLSINLVICLACKIKSIQNMMDSCHELFSFFDNSPKRQKGRLKDLYESRWIERPSMSETIFELYEYSVITLNERCVPTDDDKRFYPNN